MNSRELAYRMADAAGITQLQAKKALAEIPKAVADTVSKGGSVRLGTLGTFKIKKRAARKYRDKKTHQIVSVPAKRVIGFNMSSVGKLLKP